MLGQREQLYDRLQGTYLEELTSLEVQMTEEALQKMVERQFGPAVAPEGNGQPQSE
jgi:hypothetical protein